MKIHVLMSTCDKKDLDSLMLKEKNITKDYVIVNQLIKSNDSVQCKKSGFYSYDEKGLSLSRNRLIEHVNEGIGIITDDDITFAENYLELVKDAYERHPEADVITFNIMIGDEEKGNTSYHKHNFISIMSIVSCQISFKVERVKEKNIKFNENFGLGSTFKSGEENIFLNECLKAGLTLIHIPYVICYHPKEDTTGDVWNRELIKSKGALSYNLLGWKNFLFLLYFLFTKKKYYINQVTMTEFCMCYKQGIREYKEISEG